MRTILAALLGLVITLPAPGAQPAPHPIARGQQPAPHRGLYELVLEAAADVADPWHAPVTVTFIRPDGSKVAADAFFDGGRTFKARAYCDTVGRWSWTASGTIPYIAGRTGAFEVVPSPLKGKLRKHPRDSRQFAYDDGTWFLHIGDTGYRYVTQSEPKWREYIDQAAQMGATKIRTWFCESRGGVEALLTPRRDALNLPYWQEIERRIIYALERHPHVIFQLIPYGEDTEELLRYGRDDKWARLIARHAQARLSAFPNVTWCISNDREILTDNRTPKGRQVPASIIDQIGRDMAAREPWGTLLTNHQARGTGYAFTNAPWSDIITLEDVDQVHGRILLEYRAKGDAPVINDEDRYELYKAPKDPRYFFRRLMWASLLSGGHATYGGLKTYEPFNGAERGVQGYFDAKKAGKLTGGADDFIHIHRFFADSKLTLAGLRPDDAAAGADPLRIKCIHDGRAWILYLANPTGQKPETDHPSPTAPTVTLSLPATPFTVRWFNPTTGEWTIAPNTRGPTPTLRAPGGGDWILLLK